MPHKVLVSDEQCVELICNACNRFFKKDVSAYLNLDGVIRLKVTCTCGHSWKIILEKRRFYRKGTRLPGTYRYQITGQKAVEGYMTVIDISRTGLKLQISGKHNLKNGDWIEVEFRLDNKVRTQINRIVNIKNVDGQYVGASFREVKSFDPVIGFYMLQHTPPDENG